MAGEDATEEGWCCWWHLRRIGILLLYFVDYGAIGDISLGEIF
jgi:hypothetical protein